MPSSHPPVAVHSARFRQAAAGTRVRTYRELDVLHLRNLLLSEVAPVAIPKIARAVTEGFQAISQSALTVEDPRPTFSGAGGGFQSGYGSPQLLAGRWDV